MLALRCIHNSLEQTRKTQHGLGTLVYKVDKSCTEFSIEFSYVNPIQDSFFYPTLRALIHNIRTQYPFLETVQHRTLLPLTLLSFLTERQHHLLVKKVQPDPRLKEYTSQAREAQPFACIKVHWCISDILPCVDVFITSSSISLVLQTFLQSVYTKEQQFVLKTAIQSRMVFLDQNCLHFSQSSSWQSRSSQQTVQAGQEECLLSPTEISSALEYGSETESNAGSVLLTQEQLLSTPPPLILLSLSLPPPYKMSQPDYSTIIRWL